MTWRNRDLDLGRTVGLLLGAIIIAAVCAVAAAAILLVKLGRWI